MTRMFRSSAKLVASVGLIIGLGACGPDVEGEFVARSEQALGELDPVETKPKIDPTKLKTVDPDVPEDLPRSGVVNPVSRTIDGQEYWTEFKYGKTPICKEKSCSCDTIKLDRVTYWRRSPPSLLWASKWEAEVDVYNRQKKELPPGNGESTFSFPQLNLVGQENVCFYFTFPQCHAYMLPEWRAHPCPVGVQIKHPRNITRGGVKTETERLYSHNGVIDYGAVPGFNGTIMSYANMNRICIGYNVRGHSVDPGQGSVEWFVGQPYSTPRTVDSCGKIDFTVRRK